jgi:hypothetical protein
VGFYHRGSVCRAATEFSASILGTFYKPAQELYDYYEGRKSCLLTVRLSRAHPQRFTSDLIVEDPSANERPHSNSTPGPNCSAKTATTKTAQIHHSRTALLSRMAGDPLRVRAAVFLRLLKGWWSKPRLLWQKDCATSLDTTVKTPKITVQLPISRAVLPLLERVHLGIPSILSFPDGEGAAVLFTVLFLFTDFAHL